MFYAVRKGVVPGIYRSWDAAKPMVQGFPGAEFKKFETESDAEAYMKGNVKPTSTSYEEPPTAYAYIDGSYRVKEGTYGYGGFIMVNGNKTIIQGSDNNPAWASMRNVAGEILGAQEVVKNAIEMGLTEITIFHDYLGISHWVTGAWACKNPCTKEYRDFMQDAMKVIKVNFTHVDGHTGIPGNEEADRLAKESVGVSIPTKKERWVLVTVCNNEILPISQYPSLPAAQDAMSEAYSKHADEHGMGRIEDESAQLYCPDTKTLWLWKIQQVK